MKSFICGSIACSLAFCFFVSCADNNVQRLKLRRLTTPTPAGGTGDQTTHSTQEPPTSLAEQIRQAESQAEELKGRTLSRQQRLDTLQRTNSRLCGRLFLQRTKCIPNIALSSDLSNNVLPCVGNFDPTTKIKNTFSITLRGKTPNQHYKLIADNIYESTEFTDGTTDIKWTSLAGTDRKPPQLKDVEYLRIIGTEGTTPSDIEVFELRVNGISTLSAKDFLSDLDKDSKALILNTDAWSFIKNTKSCVVSEDEIENIISSSEKEAAGEGESVK